MTAAPIAVAAFLRRVHARLEDPSAWTKGAFARDAHGRPCRSSAGCCWCLSGALVAEAVATDSWEIRRLASEALHQTLGLSSEYGLTLAGWNDFAYREHDEVLRVLLFTAARLERAAAPTQAVA